MTDDISCLASLILKPTMIVLKAQHLMNCLLLNSPTSFLLGPTLARVYCWLPCSTPTPRTRDYPLPIPLLGHNSIIKSFRTHWPFSFLLSFHWLNLNLESLDSETIRDLKGQLTILTSLIGKNNKAYIWYIQGYITI